MPTATIKLFLPHGDAKRFRTAEVSNWTGKALAGPRTDLNELVKREELRSAGVYLLFGTAPNSEQPLVYIGEAEVIKDRLKQHKAKEFWVSLAAFVSKDENLTKAHIRYLENRLMEEANKIGRYKLENTNQSGSKLPESDREDMEVFLDRIQQVLPVLGSDILTPIAGTKPKSGKKSILMCKSKGAVATGRRTETGFVVYANSTATVKERASAATQHPYVVALRKKLITNGTLIKDKSYYRFTKDTEFSSPSAAAAVIFGGGAAGPIAWKDESGKTLKEIEES